MTHVTPLNLKLRPLKGGPLTQGEASEKCHGEADC